MPEPLQYQRVRTCAVLSLKLSPLARSPIGVCSGVWETSATRGLTKNTAALGECVEIPSETWWEAAHGVCPGTAGVACVSVGRVARYWSQQRSKMAGTRNLGREKKTPQFGTRLRFRRIGIPTWLYHRGVVYSMQYGMRMLFTPSQRPIQCAGGPCLGLCNSLRLSVDLFIYTLPSRRLSRSLPQEKTATATSHRNKLTRLLVLHTFAGNPAETASAFLRCSGLDLTPTSMRASGSSELPAYTRYRNRPPHSSHPPHAALSLAG